MPDVDPEEFRRLGHAVVDWIADYRAGVADRPVLPDVQPGWVREQLTPTLLSAGLPEEPQPLSSLLDEIDRVVVPATTHWQHPASSATSRPTPRCTRCSATCSPPASACRGCSGRPRPQPPRWSRCCSTPWRRHSGWTLPSRSQAAGADRSRTRRPRRRWLRCSRPCTAATRTGGNAASTARSASTPPPRRTRRWRRPCGSSGWENERCGSSSRRRARSRCRPTRWPPRSGPTSRPGSGRSWSAPPSARRAPARSTRCGRSRMRRPSTEPGCMSTPRGRVWRRCVPNSATCSTASSSSTRSARTPTNGCSRRSTHRCSGCGTPPHSRPRSRSPRSSCATPPRSRASSWTTATGRCRSVAASVH